MKNINSLKLVGLSLILLAIALPLTATAAPVKIMMLGDSITLGAGPVPDSPEANQSTYKDGNDSTIKFVDQIGYRGELWRLLKGAGYTFGEGNTITDENTTVLDFVGNKTKDHSTYGDANSGFDEDHEGHGGFTSKEISDEIDGWLATSPADIVLLHVGTNDPGVFIPTGEDNDTDQDSNTTVNNVKKILNSIFDANPRSKVFVARIIKIKRVEAWNKHWKTTEFNDAIATMVKNHPKHSNIRMVDMESGAGMIYNPCGTALGDMNPFEIVDTNGTITHLYDYHPNVKGYAKIAQKWFDDIIASTWLTPDTDVPVITLVGANPQQVAMGAIYQDLGAILSDKHDENKSITGVGTVDTKTEGNYTITYDGNDTAGNAALQVTRTVTVLPDVDDNGIPDTLDKDWFIYDKASQTATIAPLDGSAQSVLTVEGLTAIPEVTENTVALTHTLGGGIKAYIKALETGLVNTGFIQDAVDDSTLKTGTSFKAGTKSVIKSVKGKVTIETEVTLNKDESLTIGEK